MTGNVLVTGSSIPAEVLTMIERRNFAVRAIREDLSDHDLHDALNGVRGYVLGGYEEPVTRSFAGVDHVDRRGGNLESPVRTAPLRSTVGASHARSVRADGCRLRAACPPGRGYRGVPEGDRDLFVEPLAARFPGVPARRAPAAFLTGWRYTAPLIDMPPYLNFLRERLLRAHGETEGRRAGAGRKR